MVLIFLGLVLAPSTLYLYIAQPAWAWMYLLDPDNVPGLALLPILVGHLAFVLFGWFLGGRLVKRGSTRVGLWICGGGALFVIVASMIAWNRMGMVGTHEQFLESRALPIMQMKLGYIMVAMVLAVLGASGYVLMELSRDSRRVRAR